MVPFLLNAQTSTFSFNINGTVPAGFADALNTAGKNWSRYLHITVPIKVNVFTVNSSFVPFSGLTLANGRKNFPNAYPNYLYVTSLANQMTNSELNPGQYDMDIYFNLFTPMYYGNGAPPANQMDFISLAMHEIGHGLGFYSDGYVDNSGKGSFGNVPVSVFMGLITPSFPWRGQDSVPTIYDKYLQKASGNALATCAPFNSNALGDSIMNGMLYFDGTLFAALSPGGKARVAGGTGTYFFGEDLLHLHQSYPNTIMSYYWGLGDTVRAPAPREIAVLRQIGWNPNTVGLNELKKMETELLIYPNPGNEEVKISGKHLRSIQLIGLDGRIVLTEQINGLEESIHLNTAELDEGLYFIRAGYTGDKQSNGYRLQVIH